MFTQRDLRTRLNARPFTPFRLWLSDGGHVDIRSPEVASPGRNYAIVWFFDPNKPDEGFDHHGTIWYMHVTRHEALKQGDSPFQQPSEPPSGTPTPA
ncbi:MAG TPA: hypothetical protein VH592_05245 [Gemmataceae bacterium]|jgi:hypothetical protein